MQYRDAPQRRTSKKGRRSLWRLGRKTMPWYYLVIICCTLILMGWLVAQRVEGENRRLRIVLSQAEDLVFEKEREVLRLSEQVRLASTDQFIANEARTKYGYLFPGEIRFVVLNPE
ncbi:MAG TPA: hypothetical protein PKZ39_01550, partial [Clostridia bacterium]|nr:hypothetical protein [Clostridia bacterium]